MRDGPDIHRLLRGSTVVFLLVGCVACAETPAEPVAEPAAESARRRRAETQSSHLRA